MGSLPVGSLESIRSTNVDKYSEWYGTVLFVFVLVAVALLGTGRLELLSSGVSISAWSVSRTTFFLWLLWKLTIAIRARRGQINLFKYAIPFSLLLFFFVVAVSLLPDFHGAGDFRYFFFGCAHSLMIMDLFENKRRGYLLLLLLGLLPGFLVLRGISHDPSVLILDQMRRFGFPLDHPNTAGYLFSMSIPIAVSLSLTEKEPLRGLALLSSGTQILGLVLSYSRGAWLGGIAAMIFLAVTQKSWKAVALIFIGLLLVLAFAKPLRDRMLTLANLQGDIAVSDRMGVMKDAVRLGEQHPILGIGYGRGRLKEALRDAYQGTANENNPIWHAHNVYVELFAETGVLGLGAFLWLLSRTGFEILRRARCERNESRIVLFGLAGAWIAAAVTGLGDVPFYHHETRIFFFTILGLAFCFSHRRADDDESESLFARLR
jgi:O-antigen ligase